MTKCVVHIGTEKTGTTSLQRTLQDNAKTLEAHGLIFPRVLYSGQDPKIYCYALDDDARDHRKSKYGLISPETTLAFREEFTKKFRASIAKQPDNSIVFVVNEHLSRIRKVSEVERLKTFLEQFFDETEVVVYLRRQDKFMRSMYSTAVKNGTTRPTVYPTKEDSSQPWMWEVHDYNRLLTLWTDVWGRDKVHVRIFERSLLVGGDVITDFLNVTGADQRLEKDIVKPVKANESLTLKAMLILRMLNAHLPPKKRGPISRRFGEVFPGGGLPVTRAEAEAEAYLEAFQASNDAAGQTFMGTPSLFETSDLADLPETVDLPEITVEDMAEHFAKVWAREVEVRN